MEPQQTTESGELQPRREPRRELQVTRPEAAVRPIRCDVYENDFEYLILAELPGMNREACDISVNDRELRIQGERDRGDGPELYVRTFTLPHNADSAAVKATAREGVLRITVAKTREAQPRRIQIEG